MWLKGQLDSVRGIVWLDGLHVFAILDESMVLRKERKYCDG